MLNVIRQWVIKTMMKSRGETGIVKTIPKRDLVELNTQITAQRLMENGVDPAALKNTNQVENAIIAIESRPKVQEGIRSTQSAKVFDLEGKEIKDPRNIMGGKENKLAKTLEANQKRKLNLFKNLDDKKKLTDDEYQEFLDEIGGEDKLEAYNFDGTAGSAKKALKDDVEYEQSMFDQYKKEKSKEINQQTLNNELMKTDNPYSDLVNTPRPKTIKEREAEVLARMNKENKEATARIREKSMAKAFSEQDLEEMNQAIFNLTERQGISGDSKVDADFLAEELAALRGIKYDDMPTKERLNLYGQAYDKLQMDKFRKKETKQLMDDMKNIEDPEDMAQGGRAGFKSGMGKGFLEFIKKFGVKQSGDDLKDFLSKRKFMKDIVGNTEKNRRARELAMLKEAMKDAKGFEFPSGKELRTDIEKTIGPILLKDRKLNSDGGRAGFKAGLGKRFLELLKGKPKPKFDVERFRKGPIDLKFLENIDKKDLAPFIRSRDTMGPGGYGMYDDFADMPAGLRAAELIKTIKGPRNEINYKAAELFLGKKLKGNESADELIQMLNRQEMRAEGGRAGFDKGGMTRRSFLKILGGLATIPIVGKFLKPIKTAKGIKSVPIIKTDNVPGKPEWFDALVNKVIIEGDDVTKRFATADRQAVHQKTLDDGSVVRVTEDIDDGAVRVEYDSDANVIGEPVQMEYKKPLPDEGAPNPAAEFTTVESGPVSRQTGPDDFDIDVDEVGGSSIRDLDSDVSKLKEYATGKGPTMEEIVKNKKRRDRAKAISEDPETQMDAIIRRQGDYDPSGDAFASGGIAKMLGE